MQKPNRINFNKTAIDSLPLPEHGKRTEYRDTKVEGLCLRVTSNGTKTFGLLVWNKQAFRPIRLTLGKYPQMSVENAREEARKRLGELAKGEDPREARRLAKNQITFGQLFDQYLLAHAKVHKRTWREDELKYKRHLKKPLSARPIQSITRLDIANIHTKLTLDATPIAANRVLALLSSVFSWAIRTGLLNDNPATHIKKNKEKSRDRYVQESEFGYLFRSLNAESNEAIRDFILLCLFTGQRRSNVLSMEWKHIDLVHCDWHIPMTKNGTSHVVPLAGRAVEVLEERFKNRTSTYVFPGSGKSGHLVEPKAGWSRIVGRAEAYALFDELRANHPDALIDFPHDVKDFVEKPLVVANKLREVRSAVGFASLRCAIDDLHMHDLRRTLASYQAINNVSTNIIGKTLNHQSPQSTAVYARLSNAPVRSAIETAIEYMETLTDGAAKGTAQEISSEDVKTVAESITT